MKSIPSNCHAYVNPLYSSFYQDVCDYRAFFDSVNGICFFLAKDPSHLAHRARMHASPMDKGL